MIYVDESAPCGRDSTFFVCRWGYRDVGECRDCVTETLHKPFVALAESNPSQAAMKTFSKYHQKMDSYLLSVKILDLFAPQGSSVHSALMSSAKVES